MKRFSPLPILLLLQLLCLCCRMKRYSEGGTLIIMVDVSLQRLPGSILLDVIGLRWCLIEHFEVLLGFIHCVKSSPIVTIARLTRHVDNRRVVPVDVWCYLSLSAVRDFHDDAWDLTLGCLLAHSGNQIKALYHVMARVYRAKLVLVFELLVCL